ncbi:ABC-2 type transport system ATP-binding protein [Novosphingobium kunmingense]|uniref:ABC-2 type transport system ATP-binding protein n=1 Tax=Novosphingobium kunmingense TaxID=1211806 RepID=A0A2N0I317_9SPHN|nr:ATP-binding cassette domain-containing protein [Novosphingobium kunmingense]PKB25588.1 ABC-2 type transport system ATP-binding protein [Novosphingobium kunmingense]
MAEEPLLRLVDVAKRFKGARRGAPPVQALDGISLTLDPGRSLGLVGPDAGGKTTLMRILAGLVEADRGSVEVMGRPVAELDRNQVGYMPQGGALYGELTVRQNLELYARLRGVEPEDNPDRMATLYRATGLADFRDRPANRLSGGMRQKLALACAVVAAPPLMLLDEPSVGVDPVSRREIWDLAQELAGPHSAIVWTTSILDDASRCDDLILLHQGRILYEGAPSGLAKVAADRTFAAPLPSEGRREALQDLLERAEVVSASMSGRSLRAICRSASPPPGRTWLPAEPNAEDGFSALLDDGRPLPPSVLAEAFPPRTADRDRPAIAALQLTKRYGAFTAAQDITFTVFPGEIFGLLGPNGAGKSTTFRMLCGLVTPSGGLGTVAGRELTRAAVGARAALGYMPQKFSLYGDLSVIANLRFVAGTYGLKGAGARAAVDRVVAALDLEPFTAHMAGLLPLGIKQRLALGAAVLHTPPVLFLDEPTSGVDPLVRREFWHHINAIAARGTAVLVTTHFMDEAENCDRLLLINRSQAIASGTPDDLKRAVLGNPDPTLEQAFVTLIEAQARSESAAA